MINIGLLGCGRIAQAVHLPALTALPGVAVTALADTDPASLQAAKQYAPDASSYRDYHQLLTEAPVDGVLICLPSGLHAEAACAAFEAGVHVYLEKPIATSLPDARAVLSAHEQSGRIGAIGFNFRFGEEHQRARQLVRSGALGALTYAHTTFTAAPRELKAWKKTRDGGALLNLGSHHVDLISYLLGTPITEVFATLRSQHSQGDRATLQMQLENGLVVHSFFSMSAATTDQLAIVGEDGRLVLNRYGNRLTVSGSTIEYSRPKRFVREVQSFADGVGALLRRPGEPSFQSALEAFVRSIRTGEVHSPTLLDGYRSLAVLIAAERSAALERPVAVSAVEADPVPAEQIAQRPAARP